MTAQNVDYRSAATQEPDRDSVPPQYAADVRDLFDTWGAVRARNSTLSTYYSMHNVMKDLGISIPPQLTHVNSVVGWASKAVSVMAVRSQFEGFVFRGDQDDELDALAARNCLAQKYDLACRSSLVHGVSAFTVMRGGRGQPTAKVRAFSANQCAMLWDKDEERIRCGIVLADVDQEGDATRYVLHEPDAVVTFTRRPDRVRWDSEVERNPVGRPLMEPLIYDPDLDRPLGHSRITPEVMGIIDKAMRDVLRMEVGAEFFTAPQRYVLGADEHLFDPPATDSGDPADGAGDSGDSADARRFRMTMAYLGSFLAITRDDNGDVPQVGQFPAGDAENFIRVFESDAQRFSGATHVPLAQLGVLSNAYTSSDALSASNDPLILDVEAMNRRNAATMEEVARLMMEVSRGSTELSSRELAVQARFSDPSKPTFASRADAWTKLASADASLVGTRIWYEQLGIDQATIERIMAQQRERGVTEMLEALAQGQPAQARQQPTAAQTMARAAQSSPVAEGARDGG